MKTFIDFIYTIFIGAAVALFIGFGIWSFYQGPKLPEYPDYPVISSSNITDEEQKANDAEFKRIGDEYQNKYDEYEKKQDNYYKKVAPAALVLGTLFYLAGLKYMKKNNTLAEGLALGGVFTAVYASILAATTQVRQLVFGSITVLLAMLIVLVLRRTQLNGK